MLTACVLRYRYDQDNECVDAVNACVLFYSRTVRVMTNSILLSTRLLVKVNLVMNCYPSTLSYT